MEQNDERKGQGEETPVRREATRRWILPQSTLRVMLGRDPLRDVLEGNQVLGCFCCLVGLRQSADCETAVRGTEK